MTNELIERVALAISGSDDPANILTIHRDRARLAIKAMREPTGKMLDAARDWSIERYGKGIGNDAAWSCYIAMIDSILND